MSEDELATRLSRLDRQRQMLEALGLARDLAVSGDDRWAERALGMYEKIRRQVVLNVEAIDRLWDLLGGYDDDLPF